MVQGTGLKDKSREVMRNREEKIQQETKKGLGWLDARNEMGQSQI